MPWRPRTPLTTWSAEAEKRHAVTASAATNLPPAAPAQINMATTAHGSQPQILTPSATTVTVTANGYVEPRLTVNWAAGVVAPVAQIALNGVAICTLGVANGTLAPALVQVAAGDVISILAGHGAAGPIVLTWAFSCQWAWAT